MSNNLRSRIGRVLAIAAFTLLAAGTLTATPALAAEGEGCPNEQLRHESNLNPATAEPFSASLPECRAYEMVTPLDKQNHSALTLKEGEPPIAAGDGGRIEWEGQGDYAGAENYQVQAFGPTNPYIATRTSTEWVTRSNLPSVEHDRRTVFGVQCKRPLSPGTGDRDRRGSTRVTADTQGPSFRCGSRGEDGAWVFTPAYTNLSDSPFSEFITYGGSRTGGVTVIHGQRGVPFTSTDTSSEECEGNGDGSCGGIYEIAGIGTSEPETPSRERRQRRQHDRTGKRQRSWWTSTARDRR